MNFNWCLSVRCSVHTLFISLVLYSISFISECSSDGVSDKLTYLKVACGLNYKPIMDVTLSNVPCQCTSVILKHSDYTNDNLKQLFINHPVTPIYVIEDLRNFIDWKTFFGIHPLDISQFTDIIDQYCLAGLIFDNLYSLDTNELAVPNINIKELFEDIRVYYDNKKKPRPLLGLAFHFDLTLVENVFDLCDLDIVIDFYYWSTSTTFDNKCIQCGDPMYDVNEIINEAGKFSIVKELQCISASKILMEVNLFVLDENNKKISYGESCSLCPGSAVSLNPISTFQSMGKLVNEKKFAGGSIMFINQDDIIGNCCCLLSPLFPGLSAFVSGSKNDGQCWSCYSYGIPGINKKESDKCLSCT